MRKFLGPVVAMALAVSCGVAMAANFYWKTSLSGLNAVSSATNGDRGIVVTDNGSAGFYLRSGGAWLPANVVVADNTLSLGKLNATGVRDNTTFLRGDNTFAAPSVFGNGLFSYMATKGPWLDVTHPTYGADKTGATSSQAAFTAAIAALPATGGTILVPPGTYNIGDGIRVTKRGVRIVGFGGYATILQFNPTAGNQIAVDFRMAPDTSMLADVGISNIRISSTDTAFGGKIGVRLYDVGESKFENLWVWGWHSVDNTATGIVTQGREAITFDGLKVWADLPVHVMNQVNVGNQDLDHTVFRDMYSLAMDNTQTLDAPNAHVLIDNSVVLANLIFEGSNAWVGGRHGLYWAGASTVQSSFYLSMKNVRWEGNDTYPDGWFAYIDHYLQTANFENCQMGTYGNGIYLRKVYQPTLMGTIYSATNTAINADNTVQNLTLIGTYFNPAATITLTGMREIMAQGFYGSTLPHFAFYNTNIDAIGAYTRSSNYNYTARQNFTLDNAATYAIPFTISGANTVSIFKIFATRLADNTTVTGGSIIAAKSGVAYILDNVGLLDNAVTNGKLSIHRSGGTTFTLTNQLGYTIRGGVVTESVN